MNKIMTPYFFFIISYNDILSCISEVAQNRFNVRLTSWQTLRNPSVTSVNCWEVLLRATDESWITQEREWMWLSSQEQTFTDLQHGIIWTPTCQTENCLSVFTHGQPTIARPKFSHKKNKTHWAKVTLLVYSIKNRLHSEVLSVLQLFCYSGLIP